MKVDREGWLVKWAYLLKHLGGEHIPYSTSICALFWRCVLVTPTHIVVVLAVVAGGGFAIIAPWVVFPFHNVLAVWAGFAFLGILIGGAATHKDDRYTLKGELELIDVIDGYFDSIHSKVCPLVKIERR